MDVDKGGLCDHFYNLPQLEILSYKQIKEGAKVTKRAFLSVVWFLPLKYFCFAFLKSLFIYF